MRLARIIIAGSVFKSSQCKSKKPRKDELTDGKRIYKIEQPAWFESGLNYQLTFLR